MASVASLHVSEASMRPMRSMDVVTLFPGRGIEGDRYYDTVATGTYVAREPGRQLTVISGDSAAVAVRGLRGDRALTVGHLRRNVVVTGMTAAELTASVGSTRSATSARCSSIGSASRACTTSASIARRG